MLVKISPEMLAFIERLVREGRYQNAEEVVDAAIMRMAENERRVASFKAPVQVGLDQIDRGEFIDIGPNYREEVMRRAQALIEAGEVPDTGIEHHNLP